MKTIKTIIGIVLFLAGINTINAQKSYNIMVNVVDWNGVLITGELSISFEAPGSSVNKLGPIILMGGTDNFTQKLDLNNAKQAMIYVAFSPSEVPYMSKKEREEAGVSYPILDYIVFEGQKLIEMPTSSNLILNISMEFTPVERTETSRVEAMKQVAKEFSETTKFNFETSFSLLKLIDFKGSYGEDTTEGESEITGETVGQEVSNTYTIKLPTGNLNINVN